MEEGYGRNQQQKILGNNPTRKIVSIDNSQKIQKAHFSCKTNSMMYWAKLLLVTLTSLSEHKFESQNLFVQSSILLIHLGISQLAVQVICLLATHVRDQNATAGYNWLSAGYCSLQREGVSGWKISLHLSFSAILFFK